MFKRIISVLLAVTMTAVLFTGCGESDSSSPKDSSEAAENSDEGSDGEPRQFYAGDTREELLYGYYIKQKDNAMAMYSADEYKEFMDGMAIIDFDNDGTNVRLSAVPWEISAGRYGYKNPEGVNLFSRFNFPKEDELEKVRQNLVSTYEVDGVRYYRNYIASLEAPYMMAQFIVESDSYGMSPQMATFSGFYKVSGKTVTIYWDEPDPVTYEIKYEKPGISFDFDFNNKGQIVLSSQGSEAVRTSYGLAFERNALHSLTVNGFARDEESALNGIIQIDYIEGLSGTLLFADGRRSFGTEMNFENDGAFSISWKGTIDGLSDKIDDPQEIKGTFLYPYGSGLIITVEGKTYYYTYSEMDFFGNAFSDIDTEKVKGDKFAELAVIQKNIKNELVEAFNNAGIKATIDDKTGEVVTDDSILFGVDESDISDDGKAYLDSFLGVYYEVVKPYIDDGYVTEITVEGHTDTSGSYEHNLELSEKRAKSVADYCLEKQPAFSSVLKSKGYSYENPVYGANGEIDMAASRRVVFSFKMGTGK